jgi:hypothetical protein
LNLYQNAAPPLSTASISACVIAVLLNRAGSSSLSKNSPSFGFTLPKLLPLLPDSNWLLYAVGCAEEGALEEEEDDDAEDDLFVRGPWFVASRR